MGFVQKKQPKRREEIPSFSKIRIVIQKGYKWSADCLNNCIL
ncbi:hypothetical protein SB48_HM08orf00879 [Heyndrickxia coagulans]|uniref:Uncharacterized protein n=1 Tax=Heyndrickxia coagulans TaxID=1398 RepID=A0AAN0T2A0_HEYCO|nr:hypothetical protein SB48_HM08orf00879 [Heyndrickxia coagulans]